MQTPIDSLRHTVVTLRRLLRADRAEKAASVVDQAAGYAELVAQELEAEAESATRMLRAAGDHAAQLRSERDDLKRRLAELLASAEAMSDERDDLERRLAALLEARGVGQHTAHAEVAVSAEVAESIQRACRACEAWARGDSLGRTR